MKRNEKKVLVNSFRHSEKLHKHMKFLFSHGSMYKICNQNLMFHGCIPFNDDGSYATVNIAGKEYCGKELLDTIDLMVDKAYFGRHNRNECYERDFMWYLWCGSVSPLYGKDKMAFFERIFLEDDELHKEHYNPYYTLYESPDICSTILNTFGIDEKKGHIINGHVPVKIKDGESPVKADGKLFVIDGGISKAYQSSTGIAGYTLIYDSHSLSLAEHKPFVSGQSEHTPEVHIVEKMESRVNVADTDRGKEISEKISDLRELLEAYRNGIIKER